MRKERLPFFSVERSKPQIWFNRFHCILYTCAAFALFCHRISSLLSEKNHPWIVLASFLAITLAELIFFFMWTLNQAFRWNPVRRRAFPDNLRKEIADAGLPSLDVFICTADPYKEPPMDTANTALSAMAFDYPAHKISVYVSDDGGSKLTLLAIMEAAQFAKQWIPFCKEHDIKERNPQACFAACNDEHEAKGWREMKAMYEDMKERVERAVEKGGVFDEQGLNEEYRKVFVKWTAEFTRKDHPSVIEVLLAGDRDVDARGHPMPNLVYVAREKSNACHHRFKAGALNTLLRVSSVMSNAPILLNLDCDNYSDDPIAPHRALCFLLDPDLGPHLAYVQFPQIFPGVNKNDIYANEWVRLYQIDPMGMDGSLGPNYLGTGSFFQRRSFSGRWSAPPHPDIIKNMECVKPIWSEEAMEAAHHVAACTYEQGTEWGSSIGFRYGSLSEDFHTGYMMQCEGWRSVFFNPKEEGPSFVADFPVSLHDSLGQTRRWCMGLLQVSFTCGRCPLTHGLGKNSLINCMGYALNAFWPFWAIPITIYALVPQFDLLLGLQLFPKASDAWIYLYIYLVVAAYGQDLFDFICEGGTLARWWNAQRMWLIRGVSCFPFGLIDYCLQHMGLSMTGFTVTSKVSDDQVAKRYEQGAFEFGIESPFFFTISAAAVISLVAFVVGGARAGAEGMVEEMAVQLFISGFGVVNSWPVYEAMVVRSDSGRMPKKINVFSALVGFAFFLLAESARRSTTYNYN